MVPLHQLLSLYQRTGWRQTVFSLPRFLLPCITTSIPFHGSCISTLVFATTSHAPFTHCGISQLLFVHVHRILANASLPPGYVRVCLDCPF